MEFIHQPTSFTSVMKYGIDKICHDHLWTFTNRSVGMYNNRTRKILIHQLTTLFTSPLSFEEFRVNSDYNHWFMKTARPEMDEDYLVVFKYASIKTSSSKHPFSRSRACNFNKNTTTNTFYPHLLSDIHEVDGLDLVAY